MPFRSKYRLSNNEKDSLTGLSYKKGTTSKSAPCLTTLAGEVDEDKKECVLDNQKSRMSWSPSDTAAESKEKNKTPPLSNLITFTRTKRYSLKLLQTVPETAVLKTELVDCAHAHSPTQPAESTQVSACSGSDVCCGEETSVDLSSDRKFLYLAYAEGDQGGVDVRTRMEELDVHCLDCHRNGCYGRPEKAQVGELMGKATWIVLYLSNIRCASFDFIQQMAVQIAEDSKSRKLIILVAPAQEMIPPELKLFPIICVEDDDWLSQLERAVRHEPSEFNRQKCSLKKCPLSGSSNSIQSDCLDVVRRLDQTGRSGVTRLSQKYAKQKDKWDAA